jgi:hypothetical protein
MSLSATSVVDTGGELLGVVYIGGKFFATSVNNTSNAPCVTKNLHIK